MTPEPPAASNRCLPPARFWWLLTLFALAAFWFTRWNDGSFMSHPDERGKAVQVLDREWNYHHPMLMLTLVERVVKVQREFGAPKPNVQKVVETGRDLMALACAATVTLLAALAWRLWGGAAGGFVGLVMLCDAGLFHAAHAFKEDALLVSGLALILLTCDRWLERPVARRALAAGAAVGIAAAGKYVGLLGLPMLFVALAAGRGRADGSDSAGKPGRMSYPAALACGLLGFALVYAAANFRGLADLPGVIEGLRKEMVGVQEGHHGWRSSDLSIPHARYFATLASVVSWWEWPLVAGFAWAGWIGGRRRAVIVGLVLGFMVVYFAAISFSPKIISRYILPVAVLTHFSAACGAVAVARAGWSSGRRAARATGVVAGGLGLLLLTDQATGVASGRESLARLAKNYRHDIYAQIHAFAATLPPGTVILQPETLIFPDRDSRLFRGMEINFPHRVITRKDWIQSGSLDPVLEAGVTHVAIPRRRYERYLADNVVGDPASLDRRERIGAFYRDLLARGKRIFLQESGPRGPGFEIWELSSTASDDSSLP